MVRTAAWSASVRAQRRNETSGGSIAGAHWVNWQANHDTLDDDAEWDRFESSLIHFMRRGARGPALRYGFWLPLAVLLSFGAVANLRWVSEAWPWAVRNFWILGIEIVVAIAGSIRGRVLSLRHGEPDCNLRHVSR